MYRLFQRRTQPPSPEQTVARLRESLLLIEKREEYLTQRIANELQKAKQHAKTNKRIALMALKRKKCYEEQIEKLGGARMTMEQQVMVIENAVVTQSTLSAMTCGARTLERMHNHMTPDRVEDVMENIHDEMEVAREIQDALAQPLGMTEIDEDELEDELAALEIEFENEERDRKIADLNLQLRKWAPTADSAINFPPVPPAPPVPSTVPPQLDDKDLDELIAQMSI